MASSSRRWLVLVSCTFAAAGFHAVACSDDAVEEPVDPDQGDGGKGLPETGTSTKDAEAPATIVRVAHLASSLDAIDFCYRTAKSGTLEGPVISKGIGGSKRDGGADAGDASDDDADVPDATFDPDATAPDGGVPAVRPRTMTRYLTLGASGALTIALVPPGATSCASPLYTGDVTLDPGKLSTVAVVGRYGSDASDDALGLVAFIDDGTTLPSKARVRMIHAALGGGSRGASPALATRAVGAQTTTIAARIEPRKIASPSTTIPVDALGYASIAPVPPPAQLAVGSADALGLDATVEGWVSRAGDLGLTGASIHTGFVLTGTSTPFEVLWCTDTSTTGDLTACVLVQ
ncbi:MAG: DUF4397 domain-containing protein [Deltaproteobacteria bacterium]|nr:DUF4397 domain-containing protein [Deltaproteobacteria bacterium]